MRNSNYSDLVETQKFRNLKLMICLRGKVLLPIKINIVIIADVEDTSALTSDECVKLIKKKYWRENLKEDKLPRLKKNYYNPK
ncbi:hypothetical protein H8356DRAFT_1330268 [Neocallimastix lanati (nom. inval.)]|nr:hypothetical protein H8356DRAFT_1330268 [Neocallimastix sp. JGI-2020a]